SDTVSASRRAARSRSRRRLMRASSSGSQHSMGSDMRNSRRSVHRHAHQAARITAMHARQVRDLGVLLVVIRGTLDETVREGAQLAWRPVADQQRATLFIFEVEIGADGAGVELAHLRM